MLIELLSFDGCPNHVEARQALEQVLAARGIDATAIRSIVVDHDSAEELRFPGSPTVRVDGRDIEPGFQDGAMHSLSCRVYQTSDGLSGVPPVEWMERAIDAAAPAEN